MIGLLDAAVFHARSRPRANKFRYSAFYVVASVDELSQPRRIGLFSIDRANVFGLRTRDYGDGIASSSVWIRNVLSSWCLEKADGEVRLMTLPRMFGYAFNPVSFWLCHDRDGGLRAVLAEVRNTFGERHCYLCFHDDHRPIAPNDVLTSRKIFHVSPFMSMEGEYRFRFSIMQDHVAVAIDLMNHGEPVLRTSVAGRISPLTSTRLLWAVLANPLYPLKVIGLIHYQAVKLFLKGIRHFNKPEPPTTSISR